MPVSYWLMSTAELATPEAIQSWRSDNTDVNLLFAGGHANLCHQYSNVKKNVTEEHYNVADVI